MEDNLKLTIMASPLSPFHKTGCHKAIEGEGKDEVVVTATVLTKSTFHN